MFRIKKREPEADIGRYLPELREYIKRHYQPEQKAEYRYSLPDEAGALHEIPVREELPFAPEEARKNPAVLDSPAMKRYYHSWEKKKSAAKTFSSEVMRRVNERYTKMSAFYLPAGIDKRTFHKIRNDYLYKPSRSTAMKCCLGLKLGREESEELMKLAGFSFSPSDPSELVVLFCIEQGIWDLASVNYLMDSFDLKDLDGNTAE